MTGIIETMVLSVCITGLNGCSEATSAYTKQSKEYQQVAQNMDRIGQQFSDEHKWIVFILSPTYTFVNKLPVNVPVYKGTTFTVNPWSNSLELKWNY